MACSFASARRLRMLGWSTLLGLQSLLLLSPVLAQLNVGNQWPTPKVTSIFPPGGKAGSEVAVSVTGVDVDTPESLWFSHPGIKGKVAVEPEPKEDPKDKKDVKKMEPKQAKKDGPPRTSVKMTISVGKDVPPGQYDVRLVTSHGISNPRVVVVGDLDEIVEKEPNSDVEQAQAIATGTVVNGAINAPTDVDYFKFNGKKGQRVLLHVAAASIDSRLTPELGIFDVQNRRIAYGRAMPNDDLLVDFTPPADGEYLIRLNQFTYTVGTADYFYRLKVWPGPWIDAVFPPVVEPGKSATLTVFGRGLPGGKLDPAAIHNGKPLEKLTVTVNAPADPQKLDVLGVIPPYQGMLNGFEYRLGNSNSKFLAFASAPVVLENDDNDSAEKAQEVKWPCEIAGRVDKKRDRDWFVFEAKKGQVLYVDAISQRLGAPTDLYFKLVDPKKKDLILADDNKETLSVRGYFTENRDPQPYKFTAAEDGKYHLLVGSHIGDIVAGPAHVYRVRIAPEKHDFQLAVLPAEDYRADSFNLTRGGINYFNVFAERADGFKGDIALTVEGLPKGVTCPKQVLSGKHAKLALVAGSDAPEKFEGTVKVIGTATIGGKKVVREARPASVTWGFNQPQNANATITRHDRSLMLAIRDKAPAAVAPTKEKVVVAAGEKVDIPYKLNRMDAEFKGDFKIESVAGDLPAGVTVNKMTFAQGKDEQTLTLTTTPNTVPGTYNLILRGFAPLPSLKIKNLILPTSPVTLVVVPKQVATATLEIGTLRVGSETDVKVKIARLFDFPGEMKLKLEPKNAAGITAEEATLGPGQNELLMKFKVADDANAGARNDLVVRGVAVVEGITVNHDFKFNVTVTKQPKK